MRIFGEITKIEPQDDGTIKVVGVASSGAVDQADERVDPDAMKAALPDYMKFGALREMHGLTAAGATLSAEVGEDGQTRIEAHVVDPVAVKKVRLGVYKGFSIGGRVLGRDGRDRNLITALRLDEISLVDRPCNPEAVIHMWKAAIAPEPAAGPSNAQVIAKAIELAAAAGKRGRYKDFVVKARQLLVAAQPAHPASDMLDKLGARNSKADLARIQAAHDELVALGARCHGCDGDDDPDAGVGDPGDLTPLAANDNDPPAGEREGLSKTALALRAELGAEIDSLRGAYADLQKRFDDLAAQPLPPRALAGWARAVTKAEDAAGEPAFSTEALRKHIEGLPPEARAQLELRAALARPIAIHGR